MIHYIYNEEQYAHDITIIHLSIVYGRYNNQRTVTNINYLLVEQINGR